MEISGKVVDWLRGWFCKNGRETAVIGISGGKDSAVVAAICVKALGPKNVVGVMLPNGVQSDIADSQRVIDELGIRSYEINIGSAYNALMGEVSEALGFAIPVPAAINVPPRLRMTSLYAVAQSLSEHAQARACVVGTGNAAEIYVGYCTKWGDMASDVNPLKALWVDEVLQIGDELGHFPDIIHKAPADGLSGASDEERLGITYDEVKRYALRVDEPVSPDIAVRIDRLHISSAHKRYEVPCFGRELLGGR